MKAEKKMRANDLIKLLQHAVGTHGNLPVFVMCDDDHEPVSDIVDCCDPEEKVTGFLIADRETALAFSDCDGDE